MSNLKGNVSLALKLIALTIVLIIASAVGSLLLPAAASGGTGEAGAPAGSGMALIVAVLFLQTVALAYPILRSRWSGWRLTAAIAVLYYGSVTFLNQIESLVYLGDKMPEGMLAGLFGMGLVSAVVFVPVAVLVLGRWRDGGVETRRSETSPRWPWARLVIAGLVYLALYYLFGYYVAWQDPVLRDYYGGTDPGSFFAQMVSVVEGAPWMLPLQFLRGVLWAGLALLVVRAMAGRPWEAGLATAMLFTVPALYLLLPNPLMPEAVRMTHLVETAPYQFAFGWFAAWWLRDRRGGKRRSVGAAVGRHGEQPVAL